MSILLHHFHSCLAFSLPFLKYLSWILEYFWSFSLGAVIWHLKDCSWEKVLRKKQARYCFLMFALLIILITFKLQGIISIIFCAIFVICLFFSAPSQQFRSISSISVNSFGIYLFHSPLIYITYSIWPNANPVFVVCLNFVVFGLVAFFLTELLTHTKAKIVIGR